MVRKFLSSLVFVSLALVSSVWGNIRLENVDYPFEEQVFSFESQEQPVEMVYMDVAPEGEPRGTVVLLHGKNFSGSYFGETARHLRKAGYRVIMPDQIGFGKSTKPNYYQFSFAQLARNTRKLLESEGIEQAHVLGHSMGGMLATRFTLMYPNFTQSLTLLNPIGLEDWMAKGVPYQTVDQWYQQELAKTTEKIRQYQLESYYDGQWQEAYDPWLEQLARFLNSPEYPRMAWNQALTYDMILTQPVVDAFPRIAVPTLLIIGQRDTTALGKSLVSDAKRKKLGNYPELGKATHAAIPDSKLVELDGLGHLPHIEAFDRFFPPFHDFLDAQTAEQ